jgi:hypothetical protein
VKPLTLVVKSSYAALALTSLVFAEPWHVNINANLTTGVNTYSDSWVGGEAGSFNWASQFLGVAERQLAEKLNTKATLKVAFGQTKVQDKTSKAWSAPQKSTDLIDFEELLRVTLGGWVDPFASVRCISEFVDGSDKLLTRYVNPLDITEALGASRTLVKKPAVDWSARLGAAARQLVDRQKLDSLGVRKTDLTNDGGLEFDTDLKTQNAQKWVSLLSSLKVYTAFFSSKAESVKGTAAEDYWRYPHVNFENTLTLNIAKYLMVNMNAYLLYDRDISNHVRLKEVVGAGVTYIFATK